MKKILYIAVVILFSLPVLAGEPGMIEKKKTVSQSYSVSAKDKVSLSNSFGKMVINTWNKNEVKVDVTIIGKSPSEAKAQEILDKIRIEHGKNSEGVFFKTKMDEVNTNGNKKGKDGQNYKEEGMEINYVVYMPSNNPVNASNSFGALEIGDFDGEAVLQSKFGSLTAGNLSNVKQLFVEFGKANVKSINNGKVTIKFSKANVGKLSGDIVSNFEFCEAVDIKIDNTLKQFNLKSSYSTVAISLGKSLSADFDIKTSFGDVDNSSAFDISERKTENKGISFDKTYYGTAGKGTAKVTIKSDFGKIKFE
ncbi:MAG: hypothetical protein KIT80_03825 [Chitinophagaceae bacterium]|nr:hypothetical protein [Chitinophagaceae bacterium]MCW5926017.1 hypothetical protein [Chitinophagaceae bacterium]